MTIEQTISRTQLVDSLRDVGLERGDVVMVHSSLRTIGCIENISRSDRDGFLQSIFDAFDEALDLQNAGTLIVPTYFYSYGHSKEPFIYENSPADKSLGVFAEYIRTRHGALRSVHPLTSVTAIGFRKEMICADVGKWCYGWNSPFHRMQKANAKIFLLGVGFEAMTFIHHVGAMTGVTHFYNKAFFTPAFKGGEPLPLPYIAFVRNLNGKVFVHHHRLEKHMLDKGQVTLGKFGNAHTMVVRARDVFTEAHQRLQEDPCFLIRDPFFVVD